MFLPAIILENQSRIRKLKVDSQKTVFKPATWRGMLRGFDQAVAELPRPSITRGQIAERFASLTPIADPSDSGPELIRLLLWTVLWSCGSEEDVHDQQHVPKIFGTPDLGKILCQASQQCHYGMHFSAFRQLSSKITGVGPALASRFLYFLCWHSGEPVRPLIFDSKIVSSLRKLDWPGWCPESFRAIKKTQSYGQYLILVHNWANSIRCRPDQLEYFLLRGIS